MPYLLKRWNEGCHNGKRLYREIREQGYRNSEETCARFTGLKAYVEHKGLELEEGHIYLDEGYSGASLNRPGLDALRDAAAMAEFEVVLVATPDRLARNYVHQALLLEELQGRGCRVEFLERPMSQDPNDQLLLQIRGRWPSTKGPSSPRGCAAGAWRSCAQGNFCRG